MINETSKTIKSKSKSLFLPKAFSAFNDRKSLNYTQKRNDNNQIDKKLQYLSNDENTYRKMNITNLSLFSQGKKLSKNPLKFPLLFSKIKPNKKKPDITSNEQRILNYQKMRRYRVKLVKVSKSKPKIDNVFKLFKDNGLQFLFQHEKKKLDDNDNNNTNSKKSKKIKKSPKRLKISLSTQNIKNLRYKLVSPKSIINNIKLRHHKNIEEDDEFYKPSFKLYMKLQTLADMKFRPVLGETSSDMLNFLKKIEFIRKEVVNNYIDEINNVENRYNIERPKEDFKFKTKMQGLYHHKWKNIFSLRDYQELFSENLKGKISSKNYDIMERNFRNIFLMCFSTGTNKNSFV